MNALQNKIAGIESLFDEAGVIILALDTSGRVAFINKKGCEMLGCKREEITGKNWFERFVPEDSREEAEKVFKKLISGEEIESYQTPILRSDGEVRIVRWHSAIIRDRGRVLGTLSCGDDVTDEVQMEREFKELLKTYRTLVDLSPAIIVVHDGEKLLFANRKAAEYARLASPEQLVGRRFMELIHPDYRKTAKNRIERMLREKISLPPVLEKIVFPDGVERYVEMASGYIEYQGKPAVLTVISDVTDVIESHKRIEDLNDTLRFINKMLRHDVMNNLTSALAYLEIFRESGKEEYLDKVGKLIQSAVKIIKSIGDIESSLRGELKAVNIRDVVRDIASKYNFEINIRGNCTAMVDDSIYSVIGNIIDNAIRHSKTDRIDIEISTENGYCEIRIADYGVGIPNEIKERIFEEGFRFGNSGSTGLGLYIVKKIIDYYGGKIWVEDNRPKGSVFVIRLRRFGR